MDAASKIAEIVSAGDTLRDTAGNSYLVRGFVGHGTEARVKVMRERDQQERDVYATVAWAMLEDGKLWKEEKKK
jgi:hypothetical protein